MTFRSAIRVATYVAPLCISATSALAASNPCDHQNIPQEAQGMCNAYIHGENCRVSGTRGHERCLALEEKFLRKSGMPIDRALAYTGTTQTISALGGKVELPGIATVNFAKGAFTSDTAVHVFVTSDQNVIDIYNEDAAQAELPPLSSHQVRIDVGADPTGVPYKPVRVDILLEPDITGLADDTHSYSPVFLEEVGSPEEYPHVTFSAQYSNISPGGEGSYLSVDIPTSGFINAPEITNSSYQAIIGLMVIDREE